MREILFKAKELDSQEWVIGSLVKLSEYDYRIVSENDVYWAYTGYGDYEGTMTKIDSNTICQYTGLTDKNGNKIWENDIVHLFGIDTIRNYDWKAVVEFGNPNSLYSWGYQLKPIGHFEYNEDILCWVGMEEANIYCEAIGNIFDNPELIGEQNG